MFPVGLIEPAQGFFAVLQSRIDMDIQRRGHVLFFLALVLQLLQLPEQIDPLAAAAAFV